ncbi:SDR family NAD(P)-dependent oxidoreductase [Metabacillus sp. RGM 3146]|uniref:SDR family NAD(P)-dependent oxidoreductase n=1 Tax=Metabacillus sp. RGM 3146 TaxID=3401092 RepID=UPI003B9A9F22
MSAVVITGAGSGLGKALAHVYGSHYKEVLLLGRNEERLAKAKEELTAENIQSTVYSFDTTDYEKTAQFAENAFQNHEISLLINNAGAGHFGPIETLGEKEIHEIIDTNVKGTIFMTQAFIKQFQKTGQGEILQIISTAGLRGKVNESVYNASKFAVRGFTEGLRKELAETSIKIKAAYMGGMDTPFWDSTSHISDKSRLKNPMDIARKIFSEESEDIVFD